VFQKVVISVTIAATIVFFLFIRRMNSSHRFLLASFALYLAVSGVNLVSWHPIDRVADLSWHGLTLVQALKLGCAALTLLPYVKNAARKVQPI
jgi:high-affinity Fe2+/Pb2+ permease